MWLKVEQWRNKSSIRQSNIWVTQLIKEWMYQRLQLKSNTADDNENENENDP